VEDCGLSFETNKNYCLKMGRLPLESNANVKIAVGQMTTSERKSSIAITHDLDSGIKIK
jgi:hypothetical protein